MIKIPILLGLLFFILSLGCNISTGELPSNNALGQITDQANGECEDILQAIRLKQKLDDLYKSPPDDLSVIEEIFTELAKFSPQIISDLNINLEFYRIKVQNLFSKLSEKFLEEELATSHDNLFSILGYRILSDPVGRNIMENFKPNSERIDIKTFLLSFNISNLKLEQCQEVFWKTKLLFHHFPKNFLQALLKIGNEKIYYLIISFLFYEDYDSFQREVKYSTLVSETYLNHLNRISKTINGLNYFLKMIMFCRKYPQQEEVVKKLYGFHKELCDLILSIIREFGRSNKLIFSFESYDGFKLPILMYSNVMQFCVDNFEIENVVSGMEKALYQASHLAKFYNGIIPQRTNKKQKVTFLLFLCRCYVHHVYRFEYERVDVDSYGRKFLSYIILFKDLFPDFRDSFRSLNSANIIKMAAKQLYESEVRYFILEGESNRNLILGRLKGRSNWIYRVYLKLKGNEIN